MKLNLLPKSVSKNVASKSTFVMMLLIVLASLVGAFLYNQKLTGDLAGWKAQAESKVASANKVVAVSQEADRIVSEAKITLTNAQLVQAIDAANESYPDLYDELKEYIPSFFRVQSMDAKSTSATAGTVTIRGYLKTFQQYSDVMIALLRFPDATAIGRSGFGPIAEGNEGPFGYNPMVADRGPIPGWSAVTITLNINRAIQAPNPQPTLQAASSGGGGGGGGGTAPGGPTPVGSEQGGSRPAGPMTRGGGGGR